MRKTVRKWFWFWDFDKEEAWLNSMAAKGLALVAVGYSRYTFEDSLPGEYMVRLELLENSPEHAESEKYIQFIEETGGEYLGSLSSWVYFRQKTDLGQFTLHSDNSSRLKHLNTISVVLGVIAAAQLLGGLTNLLIFLIQRTTLNIVVGVPILCFGLLFSYGYWHIRKKRAKIKKQQQLFE